jgi:hypothetical protein
MPPEPLRIVGHDAPSDPFALREHPTAEIRPLLVDSATAAKMLAISPRTLWGLSDSGELPAVYVGRAKRYATRDLVEYVARLRRERNGHAAQRVGDAQVPPAEKGGAAR